MRTKLLILSVALVMLLPLTGIQAQGPDTPEPVREAAIATLNQHIPGIGRPDSWRHFLPGVSNNTALGCPLTTGTQVDQPITVYQIWLNYEGTEYLLYVSSDASIVVPCDSKIPGIGAPPVPGENACFAHLGDAAVNIYERPITSSTVLGTTATLFPGINPIQASGRNSDSSWFMLVLEGGTFGWLPVAQLTTISGNCVGLPDTDFEGGTASCTLTATRANIRSIPSTEGEILGELNGSVAAIGRTSDDTWYMIPQTGGAGWIAASVSGVSGTGCETLPVTGVAAIDYGSCPAGFAGYVVPRLATGTAGRVEEGGAPNRVRAVPTISGDVLFQMQPGSEFNVIDGPQCGNGIVWWYVEQGGQYGWTAESNVSGNTYYLEPLTTTVSAASYPCPVDYAGYMAPRITAGDAFISVPADGSGVTMFTQPSLLSTTVTYVQAGETLTPILDGPACNEGIVWWYTVYGERDGWIPESNANFSLYYLQPAGGATAPPTAVPPAAVPDLTGELLNDQNVMNTRAVRVQALFVDQGARLAWSPFGDMLAVITTEGVKLFEFPDLQPLAVINATLALPTTTDAVTALAFSTSGQHLALGYQSGTLQMFDLNTGILTTLQNTHNDRISGIAFSVDGTRMISGSGYIPASTPPAPDFSVKVWELNTLDTTTGFMGQALAVPFDSLTPVIGVAFSPDGNPVAITPTQVVVLSLRGIIRSTPHTSDTNGIALQAANPAWVGGSNSYVLYTNESTILSYDVLNGIPGNAFANSPPGTIQVFSQTGGPLLAAYVSFPDTPDLVIFYGPSSHAGIHSITPDEPVLDLGFSPDGSALAILDESGLQIWAIG